MAKREQAIVCPNFKKAGSATREDDENPVHPGGELGTALGAKSAATPFDNKVSKHRKAKLYFVPVARSAALAQASAASIALAFVTSICLPLYSPTAIETVFDLEYTAMSQGMPATKTRTGIIVAPSILRTSFHSRKRQTQIPPHNGRHPRRSQHLIGD
jgi:hypothetical protein